MLLYTKAVVEVEQHCLAVSIENQTIQCTGTLKFVSHVQLASGFQKSRINHVLHGLQLAAGAEGADALNLISLDGEALRQMHGVERDQGALAGTHDQTRSTTLTGRHQCQGVAVLFDLHGQGGDAFFLKQAKAAQAPGQVLLFVDSSGERRNRKRFVVKDGDVGHWGLSRK